MSGVVSQAFVRLNREVNVPKEGHQLNENDSVSQWHEVEVDQLGFF